MPLNCYHFYQGTDDLVINGSKMWITNGVQSDWICLLANTSEGNPHRNKSLICVPKETKGVSVAKEIDKIGNFCSDTAQLFFEDVVVPKKYIIGEEGKGFTYQMMQFQEERIWATVNCESYNVIMNNYHDNVLLLWKNFKGPVQFSCFFFCFFFCR